MKNGLIRVAAGTPRIKIADPAYNVQELLRLAADAEEQGVRVLVFPSLSLTGASCGDLFYNETLLAGARAALEVYLAKSAHLSLTSVVGLPWESADGVYNCAAVCARGKLLGLAAKTPSVSEHRWFADAPRVGTVTVDGREIPFGTALSLTDEALPASLGVVMNEGICADADLICVPAHEPETVGAAARRADAWVAESARTGVAYILSYAGFGESTTDSVCGGQKLIAANGTLLANALPFSNQDLLICDVDTAKSAKKAVTDKIQATSARKALPARPVDAHPFFPSDPAALSRHCEEILAIQSAGLRARVERAYAKKIVIGISGGLDSTLALLVMVRAMDALKRPRTDIIAVTMPCFGTTVRTKSNATVLCEEFGVDFRCVDIFDAVNQHFKDIGHDPAVRDVTYENAQARERTQVLMDIANDCGGMVIGTGDLSELALGWATYNGDHMSMYGVNGNIPKTLVRHLVAHCAEEERKNGNPKIADALFDILDTPVSPELLPADADGKIAQKTEDLVGPYELHDFYLYYMLRYAPTPTLLYRLAQESLGGTYDDETLKKWLKIFLRRFFNQQFKRSCLPDGPQVFDIGLSPRGAWVMPSDASSALWLDEVEKL
ncbi:MAG: NAD(+) synthase [Clostridia bacterium]|nr:NAD(+) synthase [Clostridia bacterium]